MLVSAMEQNNDKREHAIEIFLKLMNLECRSRVSAKAFTKLKQRKTTKADPLHDTTDQLINIEIGFFKHL